MDQVVVLALGYVAVGSIYQLQFDVKENWGWKATLAVVLLWPVIWLFYSLAERLDKKEAKITIVQNRYGVAIIRPESLVVVK